MYIHTHSHRHAQLRGYTRTDTRVHAPSHTHIFISCTYVHKHMSTQVYTSAHLYIHANVRMHIYMGPHAALVIPRTHNCVHVYGEHIYICVLTHKRTHIHSCGYVQRARELRGVEKSWGLVICDAVLRVNL